MQDKIASPIGLYLASYMIVFIESNEPMKEDPEKKFMVWEDTVIVKADNREDAYDRVLDEVIQPDRVQKNPGVLAFSWLCEGVTEFLPIVEVFPHGCKILYQENNSTRIKYLPFSAKDCEQDKSFSH